MAKSCHSRLMNRLNYVLCPQNFKALRSAGGIKKPTGNIPDAPEVIGVATGVILEGHDVK